MCNYFRTILKEGELWIHLLKSTKNLEDVYETIDYPDWDVPYTREFDLDGTHTIYNGVLTGSKYRHYVAEALA